MARRPASAEFDPNSTYLCRVIVSNVHDGQGHKFLKGEEHVIRGDIAKAMDDLDQVKVLGEVEADYVPEVEPEAEIEEVADGPLAE